MPPEKEQTQTPDKARFGILIGLCIFAVFLWLANWFFVSKYISTPEQQGQFGDMFGAVNALFTALAFAGLIYTVLLQRDQLALQQKEIIESGVTQKNLVQEQIEAERQLFEQRKVHDLKMEELREKFYEQSEANRKAREIEAENKFKANVLRAIRSELEALGKIYDEGIGSLLAKINEGELFPIRLGLTEDWFTVFTANAPNLGKLESDFGRRIVTVYMLLKKVIEEYRFNNDYLRDWNELELRRKIEPTDVYWKERQKILRNWMIFQAAQIKKADATAQAAVKELFNLMDVRGIT